MKPYVSSHVVDSADKGLRVRYGELLVSDSLTPLEVRWVED